jgi:hypothetical protein
MSMRIPILVISIEVISKTLSETPQQCFISKIKLLCRLSVRMILRVVILSQSKIWPIQINQSLLRDPIDLILCISFCGKTISPIIYYKRIIYSNIYSLAHFHHFKTNSGSLLANTTKVCKGWSIEIHQPSHFQIRLIIQHYFESRHLNRSSQFQQGSLAYHRWTMASKFHPRKH